MKREHGIWYVKWDGKWHTAGSTLEDAIWLIALRSV